MKQFSIVLVGGVIMITLLGGSCGSELNIPTSTSSTTSSKNSQVNSTTTFSSSFQTKTISEEKSSYSIKIAYPIIGQKDIDATLENFAAQTAEQIKKIPLQPKQWWTNTVELSYHITGYSEKFVSIVFYEYTFTGGAHPNNYVTTFLFDRSTGKKLDLKDLFEPTGTYLKKISDISIMKLDDDFGSTAEWVREGAGPEEKNYVAFALTSDALEIYFNTYQVAAYVAGMQTVVIPYDEIQPLVRPGLVDEFKKLRTDQHT